MLKHFLKENVIKPLMRRFGTVFGTVLITGSNWACDTFNACGLVTQSGAQMVWVYVTGVALMAADLVFEAIDRQKGKR